MLDRRDRLVSLGVSAGDIVIDVKRFSGGRNNKDWSRWPRRLSLRSSATLLLGLRVEILPVACLSHVTVLCCQVEVSATD